MTSRSRWTTDGRRRRGRAALAALARLLTLTVVATACVTSYEERLAAVHRAYYDGDPADAVERLDALIAERRTAPDVDLLRLEQSSALAAAGRWAEAARTLAAADERLEVLDYTDTPVTALSDFIFSTEAEPYRPTRPEKVLINTLNMLYFLAADDVESAAVEARRARVLLTQADLDADARYENPLTWALAGFVLREAGRGAEAREAFTAAGFSAPPPAAGAGEGTLLVAVLDGMAPVRAEEFVTLHVAGRLRRLQWPALVPRPAGSGAFGVRVGDLGVPARLARLDVERQALGWYERHLDELLAAAAVQTLLRTGAADAASNDLRGDDAEDALAAFVAFLAEWGLSELTPPDTRSWTLLPRRVDLYALPVRAGRHTVELTGVGSATPRIVQVSEGELELLAFTTAVGSGYRPLPGPREGSASTATGIAALRAAEAALSLRRGGSTIEVWTIETAPETRERRGLRRVPHVQVRRPRSR